MRTFGSAGKSPALPKVTARSTQAAKLCARTRATGWSDLLAFHCQRLCDDGCPPLFAAGL